MRKEDAEEYTQSLGQIVGGSWRQIALAKKLGVPQALGLAVDEWVNQRLGGYVRMTVEDRRKAAQELAAEGESTRAIAETLGVNNATVSRDLAVANATETAQFAGDSVANATPLDAVAALAADERVRAQAITDEKRAQQRERNATIAANKPEPQAGKYRCIVIDPPWPMQKFERVLYPNQSTELDYPTMPLEEIAALDVAASADDDGCHLFCWTTQKFLPATLEIVAGWGFEYVLTMVWHKPGGPQPWGLPQYNCEFVIYARRGKAEFKETKAFPACFQAPRREHSRKPDEFYELIARVCDGPRIDWFSREARAGFDQHGNEPGRFVA